MKITYLNCILSLCKGLLVTGFIAGCVMMIPWDEGYNRVSVVTVIGSVIGFSIIVLLFFLPTLMLSSFISWVLQKHRVFVFFINFLIFYFYGYYIFIYIQELNHDMFRFIFIMGSTIFFLLISELFFWNVVRSKNKMT